MTGQTDYGVALGKQDSTGYVSIGSVITIDPPEYMSSEIESTNHASGGVRQFISSKLREMTPFKVTVVYVKADIAKVVTDLEAGTVGRYQIAFDSLIAWQFGALPTSIKQLEADAQKPDVLRAEITFRPSDSLLVSS